MGASAWFAMRINAYAEAVYSGRLGDANKKPGICRVCIRVVRVKGLEPSRGCPHTDLNRTRLPIPPHPRGLTACFRLLRKRDEILHDSVYVDKTFFQKKRTPCVLPFPLICKLIRAFEFPLLFLVDSRIALGLLGALIGSTRCFVVLFYCSWTRYTTSARRSLAMGVSCADTLADML